MLGSEIVVLKHNRKDRPPEKDTSLVQSKSLYFALLNNDFSQVQESLDQRVNTYFVFNGHTIFTHAIKMNDQEMLNILMRKIDIHASNEDGITHMMLAAYVGYKETVEFFSTKNVKCDLLSTGGDNALMLAASAGHKDVVEYLLEKGININVCNKDDNNALMLAASAGHKDVVEYLLEKGININVCNKDDNNALMLAASAGHKDVVEYLLEKGVSYKAVNRGGNDAFLLAAKNGHADVIDVLLREMSSTEQRKRGGEIILFSAYSGHKSVIELLLDKYRVDVHIKDASGWTALSYAVMAYRVDLVELLLKHEADVNILDSDSDSLLMLLCAVNKKKIDDVWLIADLLLKSGVKFDIIKGESSTVFDSLNIADEKSIVIEVIGAILMHCMCEDCDAEKLQYVKSSLNGISQDELQQIIGRIMRHISLNCIPEGFSLNPCYCKKLDLLNIALGILISNSHTTLRKSGSKRKRGKQSMSDDLAHVISIATHIVEIFLVREFGKKFCSDDMRAALLTSCKLDLMNCIIGFLQGAYGNKLEEYVNKAIEIVTEEDLSFESLSVSGLPVEGILLMYTACDLSEEASKAESEGMSAHSQSDNSNDVVSHIVTFFSIELLTKQSRLC